MVEVRERWNCELKVLSPLHIGTGRELTPLDYILDKEKIVAYNFSKLLAEDTAFTEKFLNETKSNKHLFLNEVLDKQQKGNGKYHLYTSEISPDLQKLLKDEIERKGNKANIWQTIKSDTNPYIPGSSIKGAIRTAVAYWILKNDAGLRSSLKKDLWKQSDTIMNRLLFQKDGLDAKKDKLKVLSVSDSESLPNSLRVEMAQRLASKPQRTSGGALLGFKNYYETIKPGTKSEFVVSVFTLLLKKLSNGSWKEILTKNGLIKCCSEFSKDLVQWELQYFQQHPESKKRQNLIRFYQKLQEEIKNEKFLLRLGQGGGFYFKTLAMLLEKEKDFNYKNFIERFGRKIQGKELRRTSRVIITSNSAYPALGWMEVKIA